MLTSMGFTRSQALKALEATVSSPPPHIITVAKVLQACVCVCVLPLTKSGQQH